MIMEVERTAPHRARVEHTRLREEYHLQSERIDLRTIMKET
jgi:hypothetical protein